VLANNSSNLPSHHSLDQFETLYHGELEQANANLDHEIKMNKLKTKNQNLQSENKRLKIDNRNLNDTLKESEAEKAQLKKELETKEEERASEEK